MLINLGCKDNLEQLLSAIIETRKIVSILKYLFSSRKRGELRPRLTFVIPLLAYKWVYLLPVIEKWTWWPFQARQYGSPFEASITVQFTYILLGNMSSRVQRFWRFVRKWRSLMWKLVLKQILKPANETNFTFFALFTPCWAWNFAKSAIMTPKKHFSYNVNFQIRNIMQEALTKKLEAKKLFDLFKIVLKLHILAFFTITF